MPFDFRKAVFDFEQKAKQEVTRIIRDMKVKHPNIEMVYLPNVTPNRKVRNILVAMEPSFKWASNESNGDAKVQAGFRNFLFSVEDMIVHFCADKYLDGGYHITDVSKIAIKTDNASAIREEAWTRQKNLLIEELTLLGSDDCRVIPVGKSSPAGSGEWIEKNLKGNATLKNIRFCEPVLHYSFNASKYRTKAAGADPDAVEAFRRFVQDWDQAEFIAKATECMSRMENCESDKTRLRKRISAQLTPSRLHLAFTYMIEFEKVRV